MITSTENPRVKDVLRWRKVRERRKDGVFIAEGPREVGRALASGLVARHVYVAPELLPAWPRSEGDVEEVSARVLAKMSYRTDPEGVLAVFDVPHRELPASPTLVLVAVGIEKPGNLGAMARTADAAGADALLVAEAACDPWSPNAIRASTGAVFTLPMLETTLEGVTRLPMQKIAAVVGATTRHTDADLRPPTAFLIGAEDDGLHAAWRDLADAQVSVAMHARTADSLNASTAAAVLLYETLRQRG